MKPSLVLTIALLFPLAVAAQTAAPADKARKEPAKSAPKKAPATPVVGSMDAAPEKKLGAAKEPCVYKPVMTAQDMENCR
jgi:Cu/Ag efflux protein CusF